MTLHTLAVVCFVLMVANEGAGLCEQAEWTVRRVVIGIPLTIFAWWLVLTVLL